MLTSLHAAGILRFWCRYPALCGVSSDTVDQNLELRLPCPSYLWIVIYWVQSCDPNRCINFANRLQVKSQLGLNVNFDSEVVNSSLVFEFWIVKVQIWMILNSPICTDDEWDLWFLLSNPKLGILLGFSVTEIDKDSLERGLWTAWDLDISSLNCIYSLLCS